MLFYRGLYCKRSFSVLFYTLSDDFVQGVSIILTIPLTNTDPHSPSQYFQSCTYITFKPIRYNWCCLYALACVDFDWCVVNPPRDKSLKVNKYYLITAFNCQYFLRKAWAFISYLLLPS